MAINDAGQIVGNFFAPIGETRAFLYTPGSGLRELGTLGGTTSTEARGLNNRGQVIGGSAALNGWHAFLWTPTDGMQDITAAIPGLDLTDFEAVRKLNDNLQTLSGNQYGDARTAFIITLNVTEPWPFSGFANPIDAAPAWNTATAGQAIVLRFGLGGDRGLGIFVTGSPSTVEVSCATGATIGAATPVSPTDFALQYQPDADRYMLRWKTSRAWADSCRQLNLQLVDGSTHTALFTFR